MDEETIDIPDDYCCPISWQIMEDPVIASDGHTYERQNILDWLKARCTSPMTGLHLANQNLIENRHLKSMIKRFEEKIPEDLKKRKLKIDIMKLREALMEDYMREKTDFIQDLKDKLALKDEKIFAFEKITKDLENERQSEKEKKKKKIKKLKQDWENLTMRKDEEIMKLKQRLQELSDELEYLKINDELNKNPVEDSQSGSEEFQSKWNISNNIHFSQKKFESIIDVLFGLLPPDLRMKNISDELDWIKSDLIGKFDELILKIEEVAIHDHKSIYLINRDLPRHEGLLIEYDTFKHKYGLWHLETPEPLSSSTCIIQIPNSELFCFGNCSPVSGIACILDAQTLALKRMLEQGDPRFWVGACYYKNCIYLFGGIDIHHNSLSLTQKYDLSKNKWINLPSMPEKSTHCSCVCYKNFILVTGYWHARIFKYNLYENYFSEINSLELKRGKHKVLFYGKSRTYVIEEAGGAIYESLENDEESWQNIGSSDLMCYSQAYKTYYQGCIYIGIISNFEQKCMIYRFNLEDKHLQRLVI